MTALLIGYAVAITIVFFASRTIPNLPALPSTERPIKVPFVELDFERRAENVCETLTWRSSVRAPQRSVARYGTGMHPFNNYHHHQTRSAGAPKRSKFQKSFTKIMTLAEVRRRRFVPPMFAGKRRGFLRREGTIQAHHHDPLYADLPLQE